MSLDSVLAQGLSGYYRATQSLNAAAHTIASQPVREVTGELLTKDSVAAAGELFAEKRSDTRRPTSLDDALVELRVASYNADASVNVMKTADQLIGTLINTRA